MPSYSTGTISLNCGTNSIIGAGTLFNANVVAGEFISIYGLQAVYQILSVVSDTSLTIYGTIPGTAGNILSTLAYSIGADFTPGIGMPMPKIGVINMNALLNRAWLLLDKEMPKP